MVLGIVNSGNGGVSSNNVGDSGDDDSGDNDDSGDDDSVDDDRKERDSKVTVLNVKKKGNKHDCEYIDKFILKCVHI